MRQPITLFLLQFSSSYFRFPVLLSVQACLRFFVPGDGVVIVIQIVYSVTWIQNPIFSFPSTFKLCMKFILEHSEVRHLDNLK